MERRRHATKTWTLTRTVYTRAADPLEDNEGEIVEGTVETWEQKGAVVPVSERTMALLDVVVEAGVRTEGMLLFCCAHPTDAQQGDLEHLADVITYDDGTGAQDYNVVGRTPIGTAGFWVAAGAVANG